MSSEVNLMPEMFVKDQVQLICRVCGYVNGETIPIHCSRKFEDEDFSVGDALMKCASVQIHEDDDLPQQLCVKCFEDLSTAFRFKKRCEETDAKLRTAFAQTDEAVDGLSYAEVQVKVEQANDEVEVEVLEVEDRTDWVQVKQEPDFNSEATEPTFNIEAEERQKYHPKFERREFNMDINISLTPPEIRESANIASLCLLPQKSKNLYEKTYAEFILWCDKKKAVQHSESVLLAYFAELADRGLTASLWPKYSMLKATMILKESIDIKKYNKLIMFIKRKTEGHTCKKSRVLEKEHVDKFLCDAPNYRYLMTKSSTLPTVKLEEEEEEEEETFVDETQPYLFKDCGSTFEASTSYQTSSSSSKEHEDFGESSGDTKRRVLTADEETFDSNASNVDVSNRCEECGKDFDSAVDLRMHVISHIEERVKKRIIRKLDQQKTQFACNRCGFRCFTDTGLDEHNSTHIGRPSYTRIEPRGSRQKKKLLSCGTCRYTCVDREQLKQHNLAKHCFKCDLCNYSCFHAKNLAQHRLSHAQRKEFRCEICNSSYTGVGYLRQHMRLHNTEKFRCEVCSYSCFERGNMTKHLMIHTGEKPFKCDECDYGCCLKGSLKKHLLTHSRFKDAEAKKDLTKP